MNNLQHIGLDVSPDLNKQHMSVVDTEPSQRMVEWNNENFQNYYRLQHIFNGDEKEWSEFVGALRRPLPTTFRLPEGKR